MALFKVGQYMIYKSEVYPQGFKCYDFKTHQYLNKKGTPIQKLSTIVKANKTSAEYISITETDRDIQDWLEMLLSLGGHCNLCDYDMALLRSYVRRTPRNQWGKELQHYIKETSSDFIALDDFMKFAQYYQSSTHCTNER